MICFISLKPDEYSYILHVSWITPRDSMGIHSWVRIYPAIRI